MERREEGYRYELSRSIAGGPNGGEDDNWTTYDYRYLNRTHHVYYYQLIDDRMTALIRGASPVEVVDSVLGPDQSLELTD